ncbi:non-ribosomal peptide synthetase [Amycolatopsis sp. 195334CR]|uniref:non-ribosomal peptide synthetase n=1 Tax=Amycolatopsis sp. 195334CR TaxID=2814588 RepID=UPI001A8E0DB1|nr:non-ribosomal peptide synthetase [Amycolatopsis sp. 195334CR]MBN6038362.1 non-ribosomal peptide synthetase [Amycolatopsis sp. 195334CR]
MSEGLSVLDGPARRLPRVPWRALFERRAELHPDRVALVSELDTWTFRALDRWSNRLARLLREAGAAPGEVVACAMSRSARAVLAVLAVAKTGATYLPLDPGLPDARVATILADARPAVLLTDVARFAPRADVALTGDDWLDRLGRYGEQPLPDTTAGGPAYVIYTSGSTGRPKGVVVGHRSLVNLYRELTANFFPAKVQRVAHGLPFAFDASWNPVLWLLGGHEVHLVPDEVRTDPDRYVEFARTHRLSVVEAVPAHLTALLDAGLLDGDPRPESLLMGGEAVSQDLWSRLRASRVAAVNLYGPTECTVFATAARTAEHEAPVIGRPIGNTRVQVVDPGLRPVPVGEPGELLISGAGLAREYLGRPDLTAERFVTAGRRAYRTGDLGRCLPGGQLEWLGRLDDQVKINGYRIEPGEVEHTLLAQSGVRQAAVVADGTRLVAYVVLGTGTADELHERLRRVLPAYLVPAAVVPLDALPLGPHGKIDRAALPVPSEAPSRPLTPAEELVAAAFRTVLGVREVTASSDFFTLGGHSLTAAALAGQLRMLGAACSLRDVLLRPVVAQLAELLPHSQEGRVAT